ncbi:MAG: uncharacterized protein PWP51_191 [Clostridiales bacterium]|nr:uncharacterized protein [Clostridiales bacterium]MDN5297638.1 uncharacterized protein [Clostridiales bacterium]
MVEQKISVHQWVAFLWGIILLSLGVVVAVKANYGVTVATSPAYVLSLHFSDISLGTFNYMIQGVVFILMILMLRTLKWKHVFSFITNVLFGYCIDLFVLMLQHMTFETHVQRVIGFISSILLIGFALAFFIRSEMPMLPFDMFVRELSAKIEKRIGIVKTAFDLTLALCSLIMSLLFFGGVRGIYFGTLLSALTIGTAIDMALHILDKRIHFGDAKVGRVKSKLDETIISFRRT